MLIFFCFTFIGRCDDVYFYCWMQWNSGVRITCTHTYILYIKWIFNQSLCNFYRCRSLVRSAHRNHRAAVHILWQHQHNCSYRQFIGNMDCGNHTNNANHHQSIHRQFGIGRCGHRDVCHSISGKLYFHSSHLFSSPCNNSSHSSSRRRKCSRLLLHSILFKNASENSMQITLVVICLALDTSSHNFGSKYMYEMSAFEIFVPFGINTVHYYLEMNNSA